MQLNAKISAEERETLNEAFAIIERHTPPGAAWMISAHYYSQGFSLNLTYFDSLPSPYRGQHSDVRGKTFADKVEAALEFEAQAEGSKEKRRLERIAQLRAELEKAEQVSA